MLPQTSTNNLRLDLKSKKETFLFCLVLRSPIAKSNEVAKHMHFIINDFKKRTHSYANQK